MSGSKQNEAAKPNPALEPLSALDGTWNTVGTHPIFLGKTLHGRTSFEWIEGGAFLIMRTQILSHRAVLILGGEMASVDSCY